MARSRRQARSRRARKGVFIDDMGYRDLSCFGGEAVATEHIDRLAAEGRRFTDFYVNSPICSPSRVALSTAAATDTSPRLPRLHLVALPGVAALGHLPLLPLPLICGTIREQGRCSSGQIASSQRAPLDGTSGQTGQRARDPTCSSRGNRLIGVTPLPACGIPRSPGEGAVRGFRRTH